MIDLTPLEVRKKKGDFRKSMRGYEAQAVDDFIDLVADRLEQLVRENQSLADRVRSAETQTADYRERERALTEALVTAQEMREEMRRQMEREVELKMREVEADVDAMRSSAAQMREREEENIRRLRARQTQFVQSYRSFLERELAEIGVMAQALNLSDDPPPAAARKRGRKSETSAEQITATFTAPAEPARPTRPAGPIIAPVAAATVVPLADTEPPADDIDELFAGSDLDDEPIEPVRVTEPEPQPPLNDALADIDEIFPPAKMDLSDRPFDDQEGSDMELIDEVIDDGDMDDEDAKDADADGWVSTLLEGKGD
jgi:cell division initiation protein